MYLEISVVVLSTVFLLIAAALFIPFLMQIWRTAKNINTTLQILNQNLPGILTNLEEITTNINKASSTVNKQVESLSQVVRRIQGVLEIFLSLENILRAGIRLPYFKAVTTATAVFKGTRAFLNVFRSSR